MQTDGSAEKHDLDLAGGPCVHQLRLYIATEAFGRVTWCGTGWRSMKMDCIVYNHLLLLIYSYSFKT